MVRLGDYDTSLPIQRVSNNPGRLERVVFDHEIDDVVLHPDFKVPERYHDIALVSLVQAVPKSNVNFHINHFQT